MLVIIIIIAIIVLLLIFNYRQKHDTIVAYTGGLGSGKSLLSVQTSIKLLKKIVLKYGFITTLKDMFIIFSIKKKNYNLKKKSQCCTLVYQFVIVAFYGIKKNGALN